MSRYNFVLNVKGATELWKSAGMQAMLTQAGSAVASAAGSDYGVDTHLATFTAICTVYPATEESGIDNMQNNTLLKALGSTGLKVDHYKPRPAK